MTHLGTLQMLLLAVVSFAISAGLLCSVAAPFVVRWTAHWAPSGRHRGLVLLALAPTGLGLAGLLSALLPSLLGLRWPAFDHCLQHAGHSHLCFAHSAQHAGGWLGWLILGGVAAWSARRLQQGVQTLRRAAVVVREITHRARYDARRALWVLPSDEALCLSIGLLRPRIVVSDGLLASAPEELAIMISHEQAHARRRDSLVRLLARAATVTLLPAARRSLLSALELAAEQACDEQAVLRNGDRLRVAETILSIERRMQATTALQHSPLVASFGASSVAERIEAMLQPPRQASACSALAGALAVIIAGLLGAHDELHHATESLLAFFSH